MFVKLLNKKFFDLFLFKYLLVLSDTAYHKQIFINENRTNFFVWSFDLRNEVNEGLH